MCSFADKCSWGVLKINATPTVLTHFNENLPGSPLSYLIYKVCGASV